MDKLNATQFLRNDHKTITGLFRQFEAVDARAPEMKEGLVREILALLEIHSTIEKEIFYPAVREAGDETAKALVEKSLKDHSDLEQAVSNLRGQDVSGEHFNSRMLELVQSVEYHLEEEERDLMPLAENSLGDRNSELGEKLKSRKQELFDSEEYRDAKPKFVQDPNGGELKRKTEAA